MQLDRRTVALCLAAVVAFVAAGCQPVTPAPDHDPARVVVFKGLGAWWDVYDWSPSFNGGHAAVGVADVDRLASSGVQTLYIQTSSPRTSAYVLDPTLLRQIITRAHRLGLKVVAWYLPELVDVNVDLSRMVAAMHTGVDGLGIDIESTANPDVALRSRRLVDEAHYLRVAVPSMSIAAIPVTPVIWQTLNPSWWPGFPYAELDRYVDAWMPMAYWTSRREGSFPEWGDPYRYVAESVARLRSLTGRADLPVHPLGGLAADSTVADVQAMARAMADTGAIGGSLYDARTTSPSLYPALQAFRRPQVK
jgi:hypothetical protein